MENDLISRSSLISEFEWLKSVVNETSKDEVQETIQRIENAPAVDAVEVVRCKDCKWLYRNSEMCCCKKHTGLAAIKKDGSDFCSYGERRADDGK